MTAMESHLKNCLSEDLAGLPEYPETSPDSNFLWRDQIRFLEISYQTQSITEAQLGATVILWPEQVVGSL